MIPKAERFRQLPKLSLSAKTPKEAPFGRTNSAWADGKLADMAEQHGGISQIKVNPTKVRQEMDLPVCLAERNLKLGFVDC